MTEHAGEIHFRALIHPKNPPASITLGDKRNLPKCPTTKRNMIASAIGLGMWKIVGLSQACRPTEEEED